jgi:hypothetical protein
VSKRAGKQENGGVWEEKVVRVSEYFTKYFEF